MPINLPTVFVNELPEAEQRAQELLAEWICMLDPSGIPEEGIDGRWLGQFSWKQAGTVTVNPVLMAAVPKEGDAAFTAVNKYVIAINQQQLQLPPHREELVPYLLGLAILGTVLKGIGPAAAAIRAAARDRNVWPS